MFLTERDGVEYWNRQEERVREKNAKNWCVVENIFFYPPQQQQATSL